MNKILLITLLFLSAVLSAQTKGTLNGLLTDKETNNEPLPFANVIIKNTTIGTTTDFDGRYSLQLEKGNYIVVFSFLGYKTIEKQITIKAGETITINEILSAEEGVSLDEITIKSESNKEKASVLLLEQKKATVIKESIGSQELASKGVSDAAGAVSKISGVSKQESSNNVYVRGLGDRYLNTTLNGLSLPSNDVNKKNINLALFPSNIIQNVSISKAFSSEFYGDFAAGNIDITSKEFKGNSFFEVSVGSGVTTRAVDRNFKKSQGTGQIGFYRKYKHNPFAIILNHGVDPENGAAPINLSIGLEGGTSFDFKNDARLSIYGSAAFQNKYEFREGPLVDFTNVFKVRYPTTHEYEYGTATTMMANVLYKINDNHQLKYTSLFLNNATDQVGYYGVQGLGENRDAFLNTDKGFYQMNVQFNQDLIFVNQITGQHSFYDADTYVPTFKLTYGIGYNNVFAHEPDRKRIGLENYQFYLDDDPNTKASFYSNTVFDNQRYFQKINDEELNSSVNLEHFISSKLKLNYGYNGRIKTRHFNNIRYGYDFLQPRLTVDNPNNLNAVFNISNLGKVYNTEVFNSVLPGVYGTTNFPGAHENSYNGELKIHAGYVSALLNVSDKLSIVPGIRLESFHQKINYDVININPNDPNFREAKETFILPSLNIKYALNNNQNLRFTFSKTVSVPEFKEVAPFVYESVSERVGGNPDLLNNPSFSKIFNIDVKYEWFITRDEIISISTFGKQINNPVNLVIANDATGTQRYFRTGDKATVLGIELEARKNIIKNTEDETQLSAGFNFTYMHTKQDLKASNGLFSATFNRTTDKLQGASPILLNANVTYSPSEFKNYKPIASLVFSYFSDRIDALGAGQLGNIIEKGVPTFDFIWKNKIGDKIEINIQAKNLLDPKITRLREKTSLGDVILSNYQVGRTINLGFNYKF